MRSFGFPSFFYIFLIEVLRESLYLSYSILIVSVSLFHKNIHWASKSSKLRRFPQRGNNLAISRDKTFALNLFSCYQQIIDIFLPPRRTFNEFTNRFLFSSRSYERKQYCYFNFPQQLFNSNIVRCARGEKNSFHSHFIYRHDNWSQHSLFNGIMLCIRTNFTIEICFSFDVLGEWNATAITKLET